jgi:asparagine synthase (glutamine-hydrolysing)
LLDGLVAHGNEARSLRNSADVAFGYRLRKITAEDACESQPLVSPDGRLWLVADTRIDNREQLGDALDIAPNELSNLADSSIVLKAWQQWGSGCVDRLLGAFAFAVWDSVAEQLFLARDHSGARPLHFRASEESFAFATTARAILGVPGVSHELDEMQLALDLFGLPPEPFRTRFREIREIPPGHCLLVTRESALKAVPRRYWHFDRLAPVRFKRDQDYVEAFLEIFDEAVRCRLRTTGEVATELSAGLDSGSVAATAARLLGVQGKTLAAYTAVPRPGFSGLVGRGLIADEGPFAAQVAAFYPNIRHHLVDSTGSDMLRELARIFPFLDLPTPGPLNLVWANSIADRVAASGAKVLLCGALGNFTISYMGHELPRASYRSGHWVRAFRQAWELRRIGLSSGRNAASLTIFASLPWALRSRIDPLIRNVTLDGIAIAPERARELDLLDRARRQFFRRQTVLPYVMEQSFQNNQYGDHNAACSAGWGIETRDPTADKRVYEFCAAIPPEQFVVGGRGRSLIRRAMQGRLPPAVVDSREKGTQAADWYESLSAILPQIREELKLLAESPGARRLLDLDRLRGAVDRWPKTAAEAFEHPGLCEAGLPRAISVGYFIRRCEAEAASLLP